MDSSSASGQQKAFNSVMDPAVDVTDIQMFNARGGKGVGKNSTSGGKSHIVDELDLIETKKYEIAPLFPSKTPSAGGTKDFIQKNIEKSSMFHSRFHTSVETKAEEIFEELSAEGSARKVVKNIDVNERFFKKAEVYKKKKQDLKEKIEKDEVEGCTFKPKTNVKGQVKMSNEEFNKKFEGYAEKKKKKTLEAAEKAKREQKDKVENDPELTLKPQICERSKELLAAKTSVDVPAHERLYNLKRNQVKKQLEQNRDRVDDDPTSPEPEIEVFFKPTINKKSQKIKRDVPFCISLYTDAMRRQSQSKSELSLSPLPRFINENSERVLIEKFVREFEESLCTLQVPEDCLNYSQMIEICKLLDFFTDYNEDDRSLMLDFWRALNAEENSSVPTQNILISLLAVLGFFDEMLFTTPDFTLNQEEALKLYKNFAVLGIKRKDIKTFKKEKFTFDDGCTFTPEIMQNSEELAEKWRNANRGKGKIEDVLIMGDAKKKEKLQQLKKKYEAEETKECTFAPKTEELPIIYSSTGSDYTRAMNTSDEKPSHKGLALHNYATMMKEKKNASVASMKEIEEMKELEECSFAPAIKNSAGGNINSFLQRMQEREMNKTKTQQDDSKYFKFGKNIKHKSFSVFEPVAPRGLNKNKLGKEKK